MDSLTDEVISVKEALNEYFKLKSKYDDDITKEKKKIMNNISLSNKEKRTEYLKLKPKCVNCKKPGGTLFKTVFFSSNDTEDSSREYRAQCGIIADPCNLDIKIKLYKNDLLPDILNDISNDIKNYKNTVIDDKNKLLFGYITTETALSKFDELKETISATTSIYEDYLTEYNKVIDNNEKKTELEESITDSYIQIQQIKDCITKMNETGNSQYAVDAVTIYETVLAPLLSKIRNLKYNDSIVFYDENNNTCNLVQTQFNLDSFSYRSTENKVLSYNVGYSGIKINKKKIVIESSSSESNLSTEKETSKPMSTGEIPREEPIFGEGKDGITWKNNEYIKLWDRMPEKLKDALKTDPEWLTDFMYNCVNARVNNKACELITPQNLKLPPELSPSGQYDFGVEIYNTLFNKLPKTLQQTYLTFFSEKEGVKNYKMLENALNDLVKKEVGFSNGFF
jgi:hypothetical protein